MFSFWVEENRQIIVGTQSDSPIRMCVGNQPAGSTNGNMTGHAESKNSAFIGTQQGKFPTRRSRQLAHQAEYRFSRRAAQDRIQPDVALPQLLHQFAMSPAQSPTLDKPSSRSLNPSLLNRQYEVS
jgi:hypothetical protein